MAEGVLRIGLSLPLFWFAVESVRFALGFVVDRPNWPPALIYLGIAAFVVIAIALAYLGINILASGVRALLGKK